MTLAATGGFGAIDWAIVGVYLAAMVGVGAWFARKQRSTEDYFLAGRRIPVWAAALAVVATSVSAATFIGAPEEAYRNNLTYLSLNIAGLIAVVVVAVWFVPAFYRNNVTTVYGLLEGRFGGGARRSASAAFMLGRLLASGARLYIAAVPVSLIVWGDLALPHVLLAIAVVTVVATAYTLIGGLDAVIWTEAPQAILFMIAAGAAVWMLLARIPLSGADLVDALGASRAADGAGKLTIFDWRTDPSLPFSMWSALLGMTLFNMAVYGTDQDLTQRVLACRSAVKGSASAIISNIIGAGVAALFLVIGLLLYVYYTRPDLMGAAAPASAPEDSREVFLSFILTEAPTGLRGLMIVGVFAAAMSSLASSLSAMASTFVCDFYKPLRPGRDERHYLLVSRGAVLFWSVALYGFARLCAITQNDSDTGLLPFAIGVMLYAYTGLLGVFLTALFTRRGNGRSVAAALVTGAVVVLLAERAPGWIRLLADDAGMMAGFPTLSLGWKMLIGTVAAFLVCIAGQPPKEAPGGP